ncbi:hypothetical protein DFH07DRAFT_783362 [Mycena maculata]|uniref:Uncharacterized protein n=1 Tax=Mycena maculata TaxID=230809 RepID=A0AAD7MM99_9AGAR|nr:hypothetical protein DFH07DRAFT_783362 [Mycena maculata]
MPVSVDRAQNRPPIQGNTIRACSTTYAQVIYCGGVCLVEIGKKVARNDMEEKAKISSCVSPETQKYYQTRRDGHITEGSKIQKQHGVGNKDIKWGVAGDLEILTITLCSEQHPNFGCCPVNGY